MTADRNAWHTWDESAFTRYVSLVEDTSLVGRGLLGVVVQHAEMQSLERLSMHDGPELAVDVEVSCAMTLECRFGRFRPRPVIFHFPPYH